MIDVKKILITPIKQNVAADFVKKYHYSKKIVQNSKLHFGAFYENILHGVLSYGSPMDKRKVLPLVRGTLWNEMFELNRMAFDDYLPKNSESRCISICHKIIKKNYPFIKWILSFSDATQCGDGTIYRASGFVLTGINEKTELLKMPNGEVKHTLALHSDKNLVFAMKGKMASVKDFAKLLNAEILTGYQLRYIYFLHKEEINNLTVPIIPFSKIKEVGAGMYKGKKSTKCDGSETVDTDTLQVSKAV